MVHVQKQEVMVWMPVLVAGWYGGVMAMDLMSDEGDNTKWKIEVGAEFDMVK